MKIVDDSKSFETQKFVMSVKREIGCGSYRKV